MPERVVVGLDLGSSRLKYLVVDAAGRRRERGAAPAGTTIRGLHADQDPAAVARVLRAWLADISRRWSVQAIGLSAAMHSFLVVDGDGRARTRAWTWMDRRARAWAAALRQQPDAEALRQATGVPVHAMSPLVKWGWWQARHPHADPAWHPVGLKEYVLHALGAPWVTDYSTAGASGFLGLDGQWQPEALRLVRLQPAQLPGLGDPAAPAGGPGPLLRGGTDAFFAHLALAAGPGSRCAVLGFGTSGAVRVAVERPPRPLPPGLFCYSSGPGRGYLLGAAFSNAGNLLAWLAGWFGLPLEVAVGEGLAAVARGRRLPLVLPTLYGERSPWWQEELRAGILGLDPRHGRAECLGGALLALAALFRQGLTAVETAVGPIDQVLAGSALLHLPGLAGFLAGALGRPLTLAADTDASVTGAALLAAGAVGWTLRPAAATTREIPPADASLAPRVARLALRLEAAVPACAGRDGG
ncbi:putative Gluconokinase [Candidatus Hydrogenisulfobacillus filiaventi]|uniref:Putative Gluconokinase n=1 Tax=Candidatus Hydrogenisulfobacillus filiaventi TaxID=2707344 RepID=A0A6F8ZFC5_9FIRM|nr:FGGY family carbohydrate kinase [Bacillota bacterium]CAB1128634.1 putative Gluconokinase [Candidatus Hydrogenisulfobacillus filiaventi]